jgi:hypothetical protein
LKQIKKSVVVFWVGSKRIRYPSKLKSAALKVEANQHRPDLFGINDSGTFDGLAGYLKFGAFKS